MFQRFRIQAVGSLALAALLVVTFACRPGKPGEAREVVPELKLEGVRFRVYRGDTLRAFGEAGTASLRRDSSELVARELVATLPAAPAPVRVTAPQGGGNVASRELSAQGGVAVSRGDDVARTERARFEPTAGGGVVRGDDPIVVQGRGYRLEGTGFTLEPATGVITVRGGARLLAGEAR